jgi:CRP-like cAMP-binding protein
MPTDRAVAPLLRMSLFYGLSPQQITEIARHAEKLRFRPGEIICKAGEPAEGAIVLVSGKAERTDVQSKRTAPELIEAGSVISELAMIVERAYGSTVTALDVVLCLKITRAALHAQMLDDPSLAERLERRMAGRLHQLADKLRRIEHLLGQAPSEGIMEGPEQPGCERHHPMLAQNQPRA